MLLLTRIQEVKDASLLQLISERLVRVVEAIKINGKHDGCCPFIEIIKGQRNMQEICNACKGYLVKDKNVIDKIPSLCPCHAVRYHGFSSRLLGFRVNSIINFISTKDKT